MLDYRMVFFVSLDGYPMADYMTIATADAANSSKSRASQLWGHPFFLGDVPSPDFHIDPVDRIPPTPKKYGTVVMWGMLPQQMDQMDPILLPDFLGRGQEMLTYADKSRPSVGMAGPGAGSAGHERQNNQEEWQLICWWLSNIARYQSNYPLVNSQNELGNHPAINGVNQLFRLGHGFNSYVGSPGGIKSAARFCGRCLGLVLDLGLDFSWDDPPITIYVSVGLVKSHDIYLVDGLEYFLHSVGT